jgi:hypothetical protein
MSLGQVTAPLVSLFFFSAFAAAQISASGTGYVYCGYNNTFFLPVSDLITLCPDSQLPQPKPVRSCSIHHTRWHRALGCVSFSNCLRGLGYACGLISSAAYDISLLGPGNSYHDRAAVLTKTTRASAIPSCIRSLVHVTVMHARERNGSRAITLCLLDLQRPMSLAGRNIQPTAPCIPLCQFPVASENLLSLTL